MSSSKGSSPLPSLEDLQKSYADYPNLVSAYDACICLEQDARDIKTPALRIKALVRARVLGYLILYAPSSRARHEVVRVIHGCEGDFVRLAALGEAFIQWFIRPFRKHKGRTPVISSHPSRPSFDAEELVLKSAIQEAPQTHTEAKEFALVRDGFKCVVTGKYDAGPLARATVATAEVLAAGGGWHTECAHIVPESTYFGVGNPSDGDADEKTQVKYSASVLAVLQCFGYDVSRLNGPKVHSLYNVMTLCKDPHDLFDRLQMWFEATETQHTYRIVTSDPWYVLPRERVTFTTHDSVKFPLPSPEFLALHAACAKVAHLSGAAELLDDYDRDTERLSVLDPSGASSDVLNHVLARIDIGAQWTPGKP